MDLLKRQFRHPPGYYGRLVTRFLLGMAITLVAFALMGWVFDGDVGSDYFVAAILISFGVGLAVAYRYDDTQRKVRS
jgi:hypothetical protein